MSNRVYEQLLRSASTVLSRYGLKGEGVRSEAADLQSLRSSRAVLERYLFDGELARDDVAEICMKIDDLLAVEPGEQVAADVVEAAA
jgi:hypothetical protein